MSIFERLYKKEPQIIDEPKWTLPPLDLLKPVASVQPGKNTYGKTVNQIIEIVKRQGCETETEDVFAGIRTLDITLRPMNGTTIKNIKRLSLAIRQRFDVPHVVVELAKARSPRLIIRYPIAELRTVSLRQALESKELQNASSPLTIPVGMKNDGTFQLLNLTNSPHMLIAGQTKSGKTNFITTALLLSLIYRYTPDELKIAIVAPKSTEYDPFYRLPHMLRPIIKNPEVCTKTIQWLVEEMERRYDRLAQARARDVSQFKEMGAGDMPYIVLVIDDLADLVIQDKKQFESNIVRLSQKSRAVGIHVCMSTQRPVVKLVSGLVKANISSRISFQAASQVDSRIILDTTGAEKLEWPGDLLLDDFKTDSWKLRLQAPLVINEELEAVVNYWDEQLPLR